MSRPPSCSTAEATALSQLLSSVTSRCGEAVSVAQGLGDLGAEVVLHVGDDDARAGSGQRLCHPLTQSLGSAGDQGLAAGQVQIGHCRCSSRRSVSVVTAKTRSLTPVKTKLDICQENGGHSSRTTARRTCWAGPPPYDDDHASTHAGTGREGRNRVELHDRADAPLAGGQARRTSQPARRVRAADPGRGGLRPDQPARGRQQLRVQPRRRALLLRGQARADPLLACATTRRGA